MPPQVEPTQPPKKLPSISSSGSISLGTGERLAGMVGFLLDGGGAAGFLGPGGVDGGELARLILGLGALVASRVGALEAGGIPGGEGQGTKHHGEGDSGPAVEGGNQHHCTAMHLSRRACERR